MMESMEERGSFRARGTRFLFAALVALAARPAPAQVACADANILRVPIPAGVARDDVRAASLLQRACDGGAVQSCYPLADAIFDGRGMAKDEARSAPLYQRACDFGSLVACTDLGWMYAEGHGVSLDHGRAVPLHRKACDGGNAKGDRTGSCAATAFRHV